MKNKKCPRIGTPKVVKRVICEGPKVMTNQDVFEHRLVDDKKRRCFENRVIATIKTLLLKDRGRFGRSPDPTNIAQSELRTLKQTKS